MTASRLHRFLVRDRHTKVIQGTYTTQRSADYAAQRLAEKLKSPGRYVVEARK
jgi:hypothetical protein